MDCLGVLLLSIRDYLCVVNVIRSRNVEFGNGTAQFSIYFWYTIKFENRGVEGSKVNTTVRMTGVSVLTSQVLIP